MKEKFLLWNILDVGCNVNTNEASLIPIFRPLNKLYMTNNVKRTSKFTVSETLVL